MWRHLTVNINWTDCNINRTDYSHNMNPSSNNLIIITHSASMAALGISAHSLSLSAFLFWAWQKTSPDKLKTGILSHTHRRGAAPWCLPTDLCVHRGSGSCWWPGQTPLAGSCWWQPQCASPLCPGISRQECHHYTQQTKNNKTQYTNLL